MKVEFVQKVALKARTQDVTMNMNNRLRILG